MSDDAPRRVDAEIERAGGTASLDHPTIKVTVPRGGIKSGQWRLQPLMRQRSTRIGRMRRMYGRRRKATRWR